MNFRVTALILLHLGVDLIAPGKDATGEIHDAGVTGLLEKLGDALGARAAAALHHDFAVAVDLGQALRHIVLRNQRSTDIGDLVLIGFTNI